ncbi:MAG: hypothetical protein CMF62_06265 [Magnetococcales bacterium]|nr:hypothetical protein [Magnetococcales bacterium]
MQELLNKAAEANTPLNFAPTPKSYLNDRINKLVDAALEKKNKAQPSRTYLGGSRLGVECARSLAYEAHHTAKDSDFPGKVIRRFDLGHAHEDLTAEWLRAAGFELVTHGPDGEQLGFSVLGGKIAGHVDGVLVSGPKIKGLTSPALWEHKIMNESNFKACKKNGLEDTKPVYFGQNQIYMAYSPMFWPEQISNALHTNLNTNTSELHFEVIPFRPDVAQELSDRGVSIVHSDRPEEMPRIASRSNDFRCKFCSYKNTCWKEEK